MSRPYDPARHCGAATKRTHNPCTQGKGHRTDHPGVARCWLHGGTSPNGKVYAEREGRLREAEKLLADLTLDRIGDALARESAVRAMSTTEAQADEFGKYASAFQRAADVAQGSKVTIESKIAFLAKLPDAELEAALAEIEAMLEQAKGGAA